jgi:hypothetical protein
MRITRDSLFVVWVSLMLFGLACSGGQGSAGDEKPSSEIQNTSITQVGYSIGDKAPDFIIPLTNGETVSYSTLLSDRTPIFLFFFSRY